MSKISRLCGTVLLSACAVGNANAAVVSSYDLQGASGTSLSASVVAPGFTSSDLVLNNANNGINAFSNHFYHNGWDNNLNTSKYYELSIGSVSPYSLSSVEFSLENTTSSSTFWLRSSIDNFASDIFSGNFLNGIVTDFDINLSVLGALSGLTTFRWYIATPGGAAGFANHELGGAGGGLPDVGKDLTFHGNNLSPVPIPAAAWLFGTGLLGFIGVARRKKTSK